jgi:hypothetical protein
MHIAARARLQSGLKDATHACTQCHCPLDLASNTSEPQSTRLARGERERLGQAGTIRSFLWSGRWVRCQKGRQQAVLAGWGGQRQKDSYKQ